MLPGQTRGWTIQEHCALLFQGYWVTGGVLPADPDSHGREPLKKIWVHSASVCTRRGDELRIVNNGNEPWKRLCSIMGPALDDDDDDDEYVADAGCRCFNWCDIQWVDCLLFVSCRDGSAGCLFSTTMASWRIPLTRMWELKYFIFGHHLCRIIKN